jgi:hypothetical protein
LFVAGINVTEHGKGKGKVVRVQDVKTYGAMEVQLYSFTLVLDAGNWLASRPNRFTPGQELLIPIE